MTRLCWRFIDTARFHLALSITPGYITGMETTLQPEELMVVLGTNVRSRRKELGLTQQAVADAVGVAQGYIASIEAGQKSVTLGVVARIAEFLKLPPSALISSEMATVVAPMPAAEPTPLP